MLLQQNWPIAWFDWSKVRVIYSQHLPHLVQPNAVYFITFRLKDSMPATLVRKWRSERDEWMLRNPPPHTPDQERELSGIYWFRVERYLDRGTGSCALTTSGAQDEVERVLRFGDGSTYRLGDFVVMPNHVHVIAHIPDPNEVLPTCLRWKRISAKTINQVNGAAGSFWQEESFDHIMRDAAQLLRCRDYIARNPRLLSPERFRLGCGSFAR